MFGRSVAGDGLSAITEGSNEAGSVTSSAYFSAVSGATPASGPHCTLRHGGLGGREFLTVAGALRLPATPSAATERPAAASAAAKPRDCAGTSLSSTAPPAGTAAGSFAAQVAEDPELLRRTVKAFVEAGVRGRRVEVLRRDGRIQPVVFRLSRQVDAFEVAAEAGTSSHVIGLVDVLAVYTGDDARAQGELAASLPGLDQHCAVVDLRDGRCLAFRFPDAARRQEAATFAHCMQIFADEVRRECGGGAASPGKAAAAQPVAA